MPPAFEDWSGKTQLNLAVFLNQSFQEHQELQEFQGFQEMATHFKAFQES